jgi:glycosyltransferase involved in cell wall biosynthesis
MTDKQPRIFYLTPLPLDRIGGAEQSTRETVGVLEQRGYRVSVFHYENSGTPRWILRWRPLRLLFGDLAINFALARAASRAPQDGLVAIFSNGPVGMVPVRTKNGSVKRFHYYRGTYFGATPFIRPFISWLGYLKLRWWDSMVLEKFSGRGKTCLANSDQTRDEVKRLFGLDSVTVWNPLDTHRFRPLDQAECRRELGLPAHARIGIYAGSRHPMKGFPTIERLIREFPQVHWLLAVRGIQESSYSALPHVHVFADASQEKLPLLYSAADFAVFPSLYEPFGRVVAEALACSTPTIASPGGASRLLLSAPPLDRLLIPDAGDTAAFIAAVREVAADPQSYRRAVLNRVRPTIEELLSLEGWSKRFLEVTGL